MRTPWSDGAQSPSSMLEMKASTATGSTCGREGVVSLGVGERGDEEQDSRTEMLERAVQVAQVSLIELRTDSGGGRVVMARGKDESRRERARAGRLADEETLSQLDAQRTTCKTALLQEEPHARTRGWAEERHLRRCNGRTPLSPSSSTKIPLERDDHHPLEAPRPNQSQMRDPLDGSSAADMPPPTTLVAGACGSEPKKFCERGRARTRAACDSASLRRGRGSDVSIVDSAAQEVSLMLVVPARGEGANRIDEKSVEGEYRPSGHPDNDGERRRRTWPSPARDGTERDEPLARPPWPRAPTAPSTSSRRSRAASW